MSALDQRLDKAVDWLLNRSGNKWGIAARPFVVFAFLFAIILVQFSLPFWILLIVWFFYLVFLIKSVIRLRERRRVDR